MIPLFAQLTNVVFENAKINYHSKRVDSTMNCDHDMVIMAMEALAFTAFTYKVCGSKIYA